MRIFLLSILLYTTTKADDSDSKYIDLLPDNEKQEFLEKIARRILDEVQSKDDRPKESSEIPEEQLNEHDAFIQKIMKEESENLRRQTNKTNVKSDKITETGNVLRKEEEKNVERHIDLTLRTDKNRTKRESKRRVFTDISPDIDNSTEHDSKESDKDIQVKNFRRIIGNLDEKTTFEETDLTTKTGKIANENESLAKTENNKSVTATEYYDTQLETEITTQGDLNNMDKTDINNEMNTTTGYINSLQNIQSTTQDSNHNLPTDEPFSEPVELEVIQKTYKNINYDNSKNKKENSLNADAASSVEATKKTKNTDNITEISKLDIEPNKTKINDFKDAVVVNIEIATIQAIKDVISRTESNNSNIIQSVSTIDTTTEEIKLLTPTILESVDSNKEKYAAVAKSTETKKDKAEREPKKLKIKSKKLKMSIASTKFISEVIKSLRLKLLDKSLKRDNVVDKASPYVKKKPMEHNVFEISPDAPLFIKQKPRQSKSLQPNYNQLNIRPDRKIPKSKQPVVSEQPYHVPIYNYLPNNAFYNPQNVLGPNPDSRDEDDDEEYIINNDDGYKFPSFMPQSAKKRKGNDKQDTKDQPLQVPVYYFSPKNAYYNPKNYYGPDFLDSNEKKDENQNEYVIDSHDMDKHDGAKEKDPIDWQYYDDPYIRVKDGVKPRKKKKNKGEPFEVDLPKSVVDFITKDTNIDLKGYIDANYGNKEKEGLRCCSKQKQCKTCNFEPLREEKHERYAFLDDVKEIPLMDNMSKVRHMMLEKKYFMLQKPSNNSRFDEYFAEKEPEPPLNYLRTELPLKFEDFLKRDNPNNPQNIDLDYYEKYDKYNSPERGQNENSKNPIMLVYYKNPNNNRPKYLMQGNNKPLQAIIEKYKKPQREFETNNKRLQELVKKFKRPPKYVGKFKSPQEYREITKSILRYSKDDHESELDMIKKVTAYIRDQEIMDLYLQLQKMEKEEAKKKMARSGKLKEELSVFEEVLGDMIKENNRGLEQYDWLRTSVDVQAAIQKSVDMVEAVQTEEDIHPSDLELLKYIVYLHTYAKEEVMSENLLRGNPVKGTIIPHGRRQHQLIREAGMIEGTWQARMDRSTGVNQEEMHDFKRFLEDLQNALYDLHTALKYIAMVTKYKNQRWFQNLNDVHIDSNRKHLLELLLHLCTTRLLILIEESAKNGVEDSFMDYVKKNDKQVDRTRKEFVFVLKLLEEIKGIK